MKIAIVSSEFNKTVTSRLTISAIKRLAELGLSEEDIISVTVPGAIELPLIAQQFAIKKQIDAVICLGCVIKGETEHYEYVCQQVSYGCQRVGLNTNKPVIFGVLTTSNSELALARAGGEHSDKGREAADSAIAMVELIRELNAQ